MGEESHLKQAIWREWGEWRKGEVLGHQLGKAMFQPGHFVPTLLL